LRLDIDDFRDTVPFAVFCKFFVIFVKSMIENLKKQLKMKNSSEENWKHLEQNDVLYLMFVTKGGKYGRIKT
jgi:hypothetical protein